MTQSLPFPLQSLWRIRPEQKLQGTRMSRSIQSLSSLSVFTFFLFMLFLKSFHFGLSPYYSRNRVLVRFGCLLPSSSGSCFPKNSSFPASVLPLPSIQVNNPRARTFLRWIRFAAVSNPASRRRFFLSGNLRRGRDAAGRRRRAGAGVLRAVPLRHQRLRRRRCHRRHPPARSATCYSSHIE